MREGLERRELREPPAIAARGTTTRETELKSVVPDEAACVARLSSAGARAVFEGRIEDRRFDTAAYSLAQGDVVLRLRTMRSETRAESTLDWKGPTSYEAGFKHRDETSVGVSDPAAMTHILTQLGLRVSREIDRDVRVFELAGATVRFERYAHMDKLVEVEGKPDAIEAAIAVLGLPREGFTPERLVDFVRRFEARTGTRAAICDREARGEYLHAIENA